MKARKVFEAVLFCAAGLCAIPAQAYYFIDTFESGSWDSTNAEGFQWGKINRTTIVKQGANGNIKVCGVDTYELGQCPKEEPKYDGKNWQAYKGQNSLRFRFPGGGSDSWAEQRFDIGTPLKEVWMSFSLRIPAEYKAYYPPNGTRSNSKFFTLLMDGYENRGEGTTVVANIWSKPDGSGALGISATFGNYQKTGADPRHVDKFISYPDDLGKWMKVVVRVKSETTPGAKDGLIQVWRLREGEAELTMVYDSENLEIRLPPPGKVQGFKLGRLLGWSNPGYPDVTELEFLLDDFVLSGNNPAAPQPPVIKAVK